MNKLSLDQLNHVADYIHRTLPHQALEAELLDHLASLIEQRMEQGLTFSEAFDQVMQEANPQALDQLKQLYGQEFTVKPLLTRTASKRAGAQSRRRLVDRSLRSMLLSSVLTCLLVVIFLAVVSRPFSVPIAAFQPVVKAALLALLSVVGVRWLLSRQRRRPRRVQTT